MDKNQKTKINIQIKSLDIYEQQNYVGWCQKYKNGPDLTWPLTTIGVFRVALSKYIVKFEKVIGKKGLKSEELLEFEIFCTKLFLKLSLLIKFLDRMLFDCACYTTLCGRFISIRGGFKDCFELDSFQRDFIVKHEITSLFKCLSKNILKDFKNKILKRVDNYIESPIGKISYMLDILYDTLESFHEFPISIYLLYPTEEIINEVNNIEQFLTKEIQAKVNERRFMFFMFFRFLTKI